MCSYSMHKRQVRTRHQACQRAHGLTGSVNVALSLLPTKMARATEFEQHIIVLVLEFYPERLLRSKNPPRPARINNPTQILRRPPHVAPRVSPLPDRRANRSLYNFNILVRNRLVRAWRSRGGCEGCTGVLFFLSLCSRSGSFRQ